MSRFDIEKDNEQDTLFDVVVDGGTDAETGLTVVVDFDASGAHIDARERLTYTDTAIVGKVALTPPAAS